MIFAFGDDGVIRVHESEADVQREWEQPDVESRAVVFYGEDGRWLRPEFAQPNKKNLFGFVTVGTYRLVAGDDPPPEIDPIDIALSEAVGLEPNPHFASVAAIRDYLNSRK